MENGDSSLAGRFHTITSIVTPAILIIKRSKSRGGVLVPSG